MKQKRKHFLFLICSMICLFSVATFAKKDIYHYLEKVEEKFTTNLFLGQFSIELSALAETCTGNGEIIINIKNAEQNSLFDFQIKKNNTVVRTVQDLPTINGELSATLTNFSNGSYEVIAVEKTITGQNSTKITNVNVANNLGTPKFTLESRMCNGLMIYVNHAPATYTYELLDKNNNVIIPSQTSRELRVAPGDYVVKVSNACGDVETLGYTLVADNSQYRFRDSGIFLVKTCDILTYEERVFYGGPTSNTDPPKYRFPVDIEIIVQNPNGGQPTIINKRVHTVKEILTDIPRYNLPTTLTFKMTDSCGFTNTLTHTVPVIGLFFDFSLYTADCGGKYFEMRSSGMPRVSLPFTFEFTSYPSGFEPWDYSNKFGVGSYSFTQNDKNTISIGNSSGLPLGSYTVQITSCNQTFSRSFIIDEEQEIRPSIANLHPTCVEGEVAVQFTNHVTYYKITGASQEFINRYGSLPIEVTIPGGAGSYWHTIKYNNIDALFPAGSYTIEYKNKCGGDLIRTMNFNVQDIPYLNYDFNYSITFNCGSFNLMNTRSTNLNNAKFNLLNFNETTGNWQSLVSGLASGSVNNIVGSGKMKITMVGNYGCSTGIEVANFEIPTNEIQLNDYYVTSCSPNGKQLIVDAFGTPPLNYRIVEINGTQVNINNGTNPIFSNVQNGTYKIEVSNPCGSQRVFTFETSSIKNPVIYYENLCEAQEGRLYLKGLAFLNVKWFKNGNEIGTGHEYVFDSFNNAQHSGEYGVSFEYRVDPNICVSSSLVTYVIGTSATNPNAGTNSVVNIIINSITGEISLIDYLEGNPDLTGTWTTNQANISNRLRNGYFDIEGLSYGTYVFNYEVLGTCTGSDSATLTLNIIPDLADIAANDDSYGPVNGLEGDSNVGNILTNDIINGDTATTEKVIISIVDPADALNNGPVPSVDTVTGTVRVPEGTPAGSYEIEYQICEVLNPGNCDTATVAVIVRNDIDAIDDSFGPVNGLEGDSNVGNILVNDTLNGDSATTEKVTISIVDPADSVNNGPVPSIDTATGTVRVPEGTPAGSYEIEYQICEVLSSENCDTATVTVIVINDIDAIDDSFGPVNGLEGDTNVGNVLVNDTLNGDSATISDVTISIVDPADSVNNGPVPSIDTATGTVRVPEGTPAGSYEIEYQICEALSTANCDTATVTVIVINNIDAIDDSFGPVNGLEGDTNVGNVLVNDTLNGDSATIEKVTISIVDPADSVNNGPVPSIDTATGTVRVPEGTPAGSYEIEYQICEVLSSENCDTATVTLIVINDIDAIDDSFGPVNGLEGDSNVGNVLVNDTLNGDSATIEKVTISIVDPAEAINNGPVPSIDTATGTVRVPEGTPAGSYEIEYQICEVLNPANCDTATVTVIVRNDIDAIDDSYVPVNGLEGDSNVGNVLVNDTLNGDSATISDVTISIVDPADSVNNGPVPSIDTATGTVRVPEGTPAGSYDIEYQICEVLNPGNCDTAVATVIVEAAEIVANDDLFGPVNGLEGDSNVGNVLVNDTLNGDSATISDVTISIIDPADAVNNGPVPSIDTATGTVSVPAGTPAGSYEIEYQICEVLNPGNCDTAVATVIVEAAEIVANDDNYGPVNGLEGDSNVGNVLVNDTLNGDSATISDVTISIVDPAEAINNGPVPSIDTATGTVSVPAGTPAGSYEIEYQICEVLNPGNCDTAVATVIVEAAEIVANDDNYGPVNGLEGDSNVGNVLVNDTLNGDSTTISDVTISIVDPADSVNNGPVPSIDTATGTVSVPEGTPAGSYEIEYQICEVLNPGNCDTAVATVIVEAAEIVANDDEYVAFDSKIGGTTASVLDNDTLNGQSFNPSEITLTPGTSPNAGITMNDDGTISIVPGTPAGTYQYPYTICEVLNPTNCDTAVATVVIDAAPADVTIECSDALPIEQPVFSASSCDPIQVTMTEERVEGSCVNNYTIIRTWVGIDSCGNERVLTQTITVEDTTAPEFVEAIPTDVTVECNAIPSAVVLTATDNCGEAEVTFTELREEGSCANNYTLTRTWTAIDSCGNTSEVTQVITVEDTTAPVFVEALPASELYVRCADLKPAEMLTAIDTCGDATVSFYEEKVLGDCEAKYDLLRTWTATDACGNETSHTQTIHVSCPVEIYNAVTPNGDGMNDDLVLKGIECYPGNSVEIYNRWGVLVYETKNYNSNGNTFKGYSDGRATIKRDSKLPSGTYYYIIKYTFDLGNGEVYPTEQAGYLHLENN